MGFNLIHVYDRVDELNQVFAELESLQLDPPVVGHTYPFERLPEAVRFMQSGKGVGKIAVEVGVPCLRESCAPLRRRRMRLVESWGVNTKITGASPRFTQTRQGGPDPEETEMSNVHKAFG
ncbi:hypothetical protein BC938DRAFT_481346 [Jimgerdemannia flammicorona]|uniref:Uncharacterized protein n=1 Tax=Jimgerdemannia flammicorona TaxID=994334 RepID=A0A433QGD9_9FUNG|nr:hypothetical protein BC938DRAFT_481346 [Jimgerdemannia flammicorona]